MDSKRRLARSENEKFKGLKKVSFLFYSLIRTSFFVFLGTISVNVALSERLAADEITTTQDAISGIQRLLLMAGCRPGSITGTITVETVDAISRYAVATGQNLPLDVERMRAQLLESPRACYDAQVYDLDTLTRDEKLQLQAFLVMNDYSIGSIDGDIGPRTISGIRSWLSDNGHVTGEDVTVGDMAFIRRAIADEISEVRQYLDRNYNPNIRSPQRATDCVWFNGKCI